MTILMETLTAPRMMTTVTDLSVRRATLADAAQLHRIYSHPAVLENTGHQPLSTLEQVQEWISGIGDDAYLLVAGTGEEILGALTLKTWADPAFRHKGEIGRVAVDQSRSGRGVGSRLMAVAIDLADNWFNLIRLELLVRADNPAAIQLYRKFGFVEEGMLRAYGYRNGRYIDCMAMARIRD
jgi:L-phenylalanine/L-methionine N-acetyltransferase